MKVLGLDLTNLPPHISHVSDAFISGSELFEAIHVTLKRYTNTVKENVFEDYQVRGWLGRLNVKHNYSQLWYLNGLTSVIQSNLFMVRNVEQLIR